MLTILFILISALVNSNETAANDLSLPNDYRNLTEELYFIDKTELIRNIYYQPNKFIYISRPRKYGKSMNLNMIKSFFNVQVDKQGDPKNYTRTSAYLRTFRALHIGNDNQFVQEHMTKYPVILMDLKHIDNIALENITEQTVQKYMNILLYESFQSYLWLLNMPREKLTNNKFANYSVQPEDITFMEKLSRKELSMVEVITCLGKLIKILSVYFQQRVIVLIDEYDRMMLHGKMTNTNVELLYKTIDSLIGNMFQPEIEPLILRCLIAGTRKDSFISRQSSFSQKVMPQWFIDDEIVTSYFGFSEKELESLFQRYNCGYEDECAFKNYYRTFETALEKNSIYYNPYATAIYFTNKARNMNSLTSHWFLRIDNEHILDGLFS